MPFKKTPLLICLLWAFLVILSLTSRSFFPIDETRYATVAWNMWQSGDYLVPTLNGATYSHKPPLLFWLMNLGWAVFGINDWWPRLIPSLFALASVFITRKIASLLWPNQPNIKDNASFILIGSGLWVIYSTALMFDMLIAFFTVLGIWALLLAYKTQSFKAWLLFTIAIGGGLLAKGPTILLQLLPVALLVHFWNKNPKQKLDAKNWYLPILYSILGGAFIALIWAIPAGIHGGAQYQHDIFWGQTANRMVNSFAHKRPIWWYTAILPLLLFPWLLLGSFWRGLFKNNSIWQENSVRFCLAWLVPVFIAFSFISGKQVHYVLPLLPTFALIIARVISINETVARRDLLPICIAFTALGVALLFLPYYAKSHGVSVANWVNLPLWLGFFAIIIGVTIFFFSTKIASNVVAWLSASSIALISIAMFVLIQTAGDAYDIRPISYKVKALQAANVPVAFLGKYAGTYDFVGRLKQAPDSVESDTVLAWFEAHPNGRVITFFKRNNTPSQAGFTQDYKGKVIAVLNYDEWLKHDAAEQTNSDTP